MAPLSQETITRLKEYNYSPLIFKTEREATLMLQRLDKYRDLNNHHVGETLNNALQQQQQQQGARLNTLLQVQLRQQQQFQLRQQKRYVSDIIIIASIFFLIVKVFVLICYLLIRVLVLVVSIRGNISLIT